MIRNLHQDYTQALVPTDPDVGFSSTPPLTLLPDFSPTQKKGSDFFWPFNEMPGARQPSNSQQYPSIIPQDMPGLQRRRNRLVMSKPKEEIYLPVEVWDMILNEVETL